MIDFAIVSFNSYNNGCIQAECLKQWEKPGSLHYDKNATIFKQKETEP